ncbi:hypothetical protein ACQJBY_015253 [Aegilops geniculata]
MDQIRRSIVRISFDWRNRNGNTMDITQPGIIMSVEEGVSCLVIVDGTFLIKERNSGNIGVEKEVKVQLPTEEGYGEETQFDLIEIPSVQNRLCGLKVKQTNDYVEAVNLETKRIDQLNIVHAFVFQRGYMPPAAYCPGSVVFVGDEFVYSGCYVHEYASFGSPIFNRNNHLVGILYASQSRISAWSVQYLEHTLLKAPEISSEIGNISYLSEGLPREQGAA